MKMKLIRKKVYGNKYMDKLLPIITKLMIKFNLMEKMIIVRCDGGICSQIKFYLLGIYFMEKGYKVKFDNDWFQLCGKDVDGIFDRKFQLIKAFPNLLYNLASPKENFYYRKCLRHINDSNKGKSEWDKKTPPVYLDGYYGYAFDSKKMKEIVKRYFQIDYNVLDRKNKELLKQIRERNSVGVHVRRGDLAKFLPSHGNPLSSVFYLHAIQKLKEVVQEEDLFFYFFSDEPDWVRENLLPLLVSEINENFFIVDINGSDNGYMDLFLLTQCKYIISSNGSLGKYAALLSSDSIKKIILVNRKGVEWWKSVLNNAIVIDEK